MESEIVKILKSEGFKMVIGRDSILEAIKRNAKSDKKLLCSGYGVFPDGGRCPGCDDCEKEGGNENIR